MRLELENYNSFGLSPELADYRQALFLRSYSMIGPGQLSFSLKTYKVALPSYDLA